MKTFRIQCTRYGFVDIQAEDWDEAEEKASNLSPHDFDCCESEIEVMDEIADWDISTHTIDGFNVDDAAGG
jgi:hypothetical protein